ncbi:MAG: aminodeoxychorismate/anthranilate synthase component II [Phycisphaerae bacterium]|jgi:anthranilate synthase/aminodeoxychorismate synthase-like glutamine amidotransferase
MILLIDNYDSFTYNLEQYIRELHADTVVYRNDKITTDEIREMNPEAIVISPGPGRPDDAGVSLEVVRQFSGNIPILGVCLGHQTIGQAFGGRVVKAKRIMHGKTSMITNDSKGVFEGFTKPFQAMRYHSLVVERESLPAELIITAESDDGEIMGLRHKSHPTEGVQFHPESIMSPQGKRLLRNFLSQARMFGDSDGGTGRLAEAIL